MDVSALTYILKKYLWVAAYGISIGINRVLHYLYAKSCDLRWWCGLKLARYK